MTITSVININIIVDLPSVNNIKVDLPSVNKKTKNFGKNSNIMKYNILHTPSEVGVLVSILFSYTPEEAMSGGLAKACVPIKNWFCWEEIEFLKVLIFISVKNFKIWKGGVQLQKILLEQQVLDPPAMKTELWGIPIAHPTLRTDQKDPQILLKAVWHHRVLVGSLLFTSLTEIELVRALG